MYKFDPLVVILKNLLKIFPFILPNLKLSSGNILTANKKKNYKLSVKD